MSGIKRDFLKASIEHLREIIKKNVDDEDEFFVCDWISDWNKDDLDINDYLDYIDSYHAHMVDKHDISSKKLDGIDKQYINSINQLDRDIEEYKDAMPTLRDIPWYEKALNFAGGTVVSLVKDNIEGMVYLPYAIVDTQHGRFEHLSKRGKHLEEVNFDFESTGKQDPSGKHDIIMK